MSILSYIFVLASLALPLANARAASPMESRYIARQSSRHSTARSYGIWRFGWQRECMLTWNPSLFLSHFQWSSSNIHATPVFLNIQNHKFMLSPYHLWLIDCWIVSLQLIKANDRTVSLPSRIIINEALFKFKLFSSKFEALLAEADIGENLAYYSCQFSFCERIVVILAGPE